MEFTTLGNIVVSTLFSMGRPTGGKDYTWMKQQLIEYLKFKMPQDGLLYTNVDYVTLSPSNKVYTLPSDCVSVTKIGYLSGNRVYSLTVDPNLALPETSDFQCEGFPSSGNYSGLLVNTNYNFDSTATISDFSAASGGRNVNYYRINGRQIVFSNEIPNGKLVIEYVGLGGLDDGTLIEPAYTMAIKAWLMRLWHLHKGDKNMVAFYSSEYEMEIYNSNNVLYSPMLTELVDAVRRSTHFNLN